MPSPRLSSLPWLLLGACAAFALASNIGGDGPNSIASLSLDGLDEKLQECSIVQQLNVEKAAHHAAEASSSMDALLAMLFPGGPAVNAILATLCVPPGVELPFLRLLWKHFQPSVLLLASMCNY